MINGTVSSGKGFYVGDIAYVLGEDVYDTVFAASDFADGVYDVVRYRVGSDEVYITDGETFDNIWSGDAELLSRISFAAVGATVGDGKFRDGDGRIYPVDSGTLGIVPAELIEQECSGGQFFEGAGKAEFFAGNGALEITLPDGSKVRISVD